MSEKKVVDLTQYQESAKEQIEVKKKELELKKHKVNTQHAQLIEAQTQMKLLQGLDITAPPSDYIDKIVESSKAYHARAKTRSQFIANIKEFNAFVPFFSQNIILIGAVSGHGKSTCCANIVYTQLLQGKRPLVITNETTAAEVYNSVAALLNNVRYGNHDQMSQENVDKIHETVKKLTSLMHVIDNAYGLVNEYGITDMTTSVEGIEFILDKLTEKQEQEGIWFDSVIIDYFQNFDSSKLVPSMSKVEALTRVSSKLDQFKNHYNAPVVVFAQLKSDSADEKVSAKERLEWCKGIVNRATCFLEIKASRKDMSTKWIIHKSRYNDYPNSFFETGWEKGKYVPFTEEFKAKVHEYRLKAIQDGSAKKEGEND